MTHSKVIFFVIMNLDIVWITLNFPCCCRISRTSVCCVPRHSQRLETCATITTNILATGHIAVQHVEKVLRRKAHWTPTKSCTINIKYSVHVCTLWCHNLSFETDMNITKQIGSLLLEKSLVVKRTCNTLRITHNFIPYI